MKFLTFRGLEAFEHITFYNLTSEFLMCTFRSRRSTRRSVRMLETLNLYSIKNVEALEFLKLQDTSTFEPSKHFDSSNLKFFVFKTPKAF